MKKQTNRQKIMFQKISYQKLIFSQSFAEYDRLLSDKSVFVVTPAILAAMDSTRSKCFFVGRRGTGKTAITYYLQEKQKDVIQIHPQLFASLATLLKEVDLSDTRQKPVQTLIASFRRAIVDEVAEYLLKKKIISWSHINNDLSRERQFIEDFDFDSRTLVFVEESIKLLQTSNDRQWLKFMSKSKDIGKLIETECPNHKEILVLIDRIDDTWDGSDSAVVLLMALMHACLEVAGAIKCIRPMLFLRENIFERVRQIDNEFVRLETCVVSLDWNENLLSELVERRLQLKLNPKPKIGHTWDLLFEMASGKSSKELVFKFCQHRPRDVITYCAFAIESAQSQGHNKVQIEDLQQAKRRFSESRLKDLGDEYSENYPHIALVLARLHGLADSFTVYAIEGFVNRLIVDDEVKNCCGKWIFRYTATHQFIELLYSIGFWGIGAVGVDAQFRGVGVKAADYPPISSNTHVTIHPSYVDALDLQHRIINSFDDIGPLQKDGMLHELPDSFFSLVDYRTKLTSLLDAISSIPDGKVGEDKFEEFIGDLIKLCFFRFLTNVQPQQRDVDGRIVRDWIASNVAHNGFWEMVRQRHGATQIIWECKNYKELKAGDFHQTAYYMNPQIGNFAILCFRGEDRDKSHYQQHIRRISQSHNGIVMLLTDKDFKVFLRQAINGNIKESHLREIYDTIIRKIS